MTTIEHVATHAAEQTEAPAPWAAVDAVNLRQSAGDTQILHDINLDVHHGELVAIAGGSGAGKSTLLSALAGVAAPSGGHALINGVNAGEARSSVGFVPQDDIIHLDLPLARTLRHAARLRFPNDTGPQEVDNAVDRVLARLDLTERAELTVGSLSGGQRKRASIATELLTSPNVLMLDEPTSGLDPATGANVIRQLRRLADRCTAVVFTTHAPADLATADRVVFLSNDGHVAFIGTPDAALAHFRVDRLVEVYDLVAGAAPAPTTAKPGTPLVAGPMVRTTSPGRQFLALVARNRDLLIGNRLTLSILVGSPAMVVGMMAILFRPGSFGPDAVSSIPAIQTLFWVAFASFFFGVTYGLLQIVGEFEIFKRERHRGLSIGAYVASKAAVLLPLLVAVNALMLVVLRALDRLPAASSQAWAEILFGSVLISAAAVAMGLFASAVVRNSAQATLALPMLCFPQVLFAGAVVPVAEMTVVGKAMSTWQADRWGLESLARSFGLEQAVRVDPAGAGYVDAFTGSPAAGWLVMAVVVTVALVGTAVVLDRRTRVAKVT